MRNILLLIPLRAPPGILGGTWHLMGHFSDQERGVDDSLRKAIAFLGPNWCYQGDGLLTASIKGNTYAAYLVIPIKD